MSDARLTNQKVLLAEGGSKPRTAQEIRAHRARERKKFENWFRRKWGGISRDVIDKRVKAPFGPDEMDSIILGGLLRQLAWYDKHEVLVVCA